MRANKLKYLVPNAITFLSLIGGCGAILAAVEGDLTVSATLIFLSYWLDMLDGMSARRLNAQSEFGLQLDSLVDIVSLGVAPAFAVYQHMRYQGLEIILAAPFVILLVLAGAFRLARFNLLPRKTTKSRDSVGLTITQAGGTLALAVLADVVSTPGFLNILVYIPLLVVLSGLMVSTIPFPPSSWFFSTHRFGRIFLIFLLTLIAILPTFRTWFIIYMIYIVVSLGRAIYLRYWPGLLHEQQSST